MPTPIWPIVSTNYNHGYRGIVWDIPKIPTYHTVEHLAVTGRRAATAQWSHSRTKFTLRYSILKDDLTLPANQLGAYPLNELKTVEGFFDKMKGAATPFFFPFRFDRRTIGEVISASTPAIAADPTNPTSRVYQVVRTFGGNTAPVGGVDVSIGADLLPGAPVVYDDASPVTFSANDPKDGWITLTTAPGAGSVLTIDCAYYARVAFAQDSAEFRTFGRNFWDLRQLEMQMARF